MVETRPDDGWPWQPGGHMPQPIPRPADPMVPPVVPEDPGGPDASEFGGSGRDHPSAGILTGVVGSEMQPPPHEFTMEENMRRLYRTDEDDPASGSDLTGFFPGA